MKGRGPIDQKGSEIENHGSLKMKEVHLQKRNKISPLLSRLLF